MSKFFLLFVMFLSTVPVAYGEEDLGTYLRNFDYADRIDMKISSSELLSLLVDNKIQFIDIRFKEEYAAWHVAGSINIPINELPDRLAELDKSKIIVTACPHKDRAIMARTFLATKGFQSKYLKDGLIDLIENLRGDKAKSFMATLGK